MDDNAYLDTIKDINWDTFYQQKMALESLTDYLHRNKEQENGMFGSCLLYTSTRAPQALC